MGMFYLGASIIGTIVPFLFFGGFFQTQGFDVPLFVGLLFASGPNAGFTSDLLIASGVFWMMAGRILKKEQALHYLPIFILLNLCIGLSCALPAFLYWQDRQQNRL